MSKLRTSMAALLVSATAVAGMSVLTAGPAVAGGQDTTLSCSPDTTPSGANILRCTATDANGIKTVVVGSTTQVTTDCGDTARTVGFTVPNDGTKRSVFIVDCANQRERAKFTIRPDGSVVGPTFKFV
ncbi:MAG: hypothetical protein V7605_1014 [Acidimicrobiaceae bacterium]